MAVHNSPRVPGNLVGVKCFLLVHLFSRRFSLGSPPSSLNYSAIYAPVKKNPKRALTVWSKISYLSGHRIAPRPHGSMWRKIQNIFSPEMIKTIRSRSWPENGLRWAQPIDNKGIGECFPKTDRHSPSPTPTRRRSVKKKGWGGP